MNDTPSTCLTRCLQSGPRHGHGSRQFGGLRLQRVTSSLSPLIHSLRATRRRSNSSAAIHDSDDAKPLCIHLFLLDNHSSLKLMGIKLLSLPFYKNLASLSHLLSYSASFLRSYIHHMLYIHSAQLSCTITSIGVNLSILRSLLLHHFHTLPGRGWQP